MTRLNDRLLVQRVDDQLVILDEQTGAEVVFDPEMRGRLLETAAHLFPSERKVPGTVKRVVGIVDDFGDYEGEVEVSDLAHADVATSLMVIGSIVKPGRHPERKDVDVSIHAPVIDLDVPVTYVPSTTEGHGHLYVDVPMTADQQWALLAVMVSVGLVEPGFLAASMKRGYTAVRLPWIKKAEPAPVDTADQVKAFEDLFLDETKVEPL